MAWQQNDLTHPQVFVLPDLIHLASYLTSHLSPVDRGLPVVHLSSTPSARLD
jgi:hypothetical protein